ncbi:hypothetical protein VV11_016625 [Trichodesmium erythraeum 21-75]|nr:hypothetical protein [Trichodesmium erythraeum 21-75]
MEPEVYWKKARVSGSIFGSFHFGASEDDILSVAIQGNWLSLGAKSRFFANFFFNLL